ncbi:MAG: PKD domain-containing protein [Patescibacteria group bacterium]|nr:PKD domain-containing protein [Patescibacteria group bacterium]MDD4303914.1 PKD domain-containing protein [Patescibacteria group bacterium]MDD4695099.1 PKD domain-containing protein [Patescibacteria group bacterium]
MENIKATSDGGCIMVGSTNSYRSGGQDAYIIKIDIYGNLQWSRTFGGSQQDIAYCVDETPTGYCITGFTRSYDSPDNTNLWLFKVDTAGSYQWMRTYGGSQDDVGVSLQYTTDNGYIITGYIRSNNELSGDPSGDIWLIKTNWFGEREWHRRFVFDDCWDVGRSVTQTSDGGYAIAGKQNNKACLIKTDSNGSLQWTRDFPGYPDCYSMQQISDGGYILCGATTNISGTWDFYLLKTDSDGNLQWSRNFGGTQEDYGRSVAQTSDGGYVIFGTTNSFGLGNYDTWVIKTDANGNEQWNKTIGTTGDNQGYSIAQTLDDGYVMAGYSDEQAYAIRLRGRLVLFNGTPTSGYIPLTVTFSDQSIIQNLVTSWQWTFGDGQTSLEQNPIHTYTQAGQYSVKLKIIDSSGVADSLIKTNYITVLEVPPAPPENLTITISGRNAILNWEPVTTTIFNNPITITGYVIYFSEIPDTNFWYLGCTEAITYTHYRVTQYASGMFYRVVAVTDDWNRIRSITQRNPHIQLGQLNALLKKE